MCKGAASRQVWLQQPQEQGLLLLLLWMPAAAQVQLRLPQEWMVLVQARLIRQVLRQQQLQHPLATKTQALLVLLLLLMMVVVSLQQAKPQVLLVLLLVQQSSSRA